MGIETITSFLSSAPTDWIIIGSFALVALIDALRVGSSRIATLGIAGIIALVVVETIPAAALLGEVSEKFSTPVLQAALFGVVFGLLFLLIRRIFIDYGEEGGQPLQAIFAAVAVTGLVVVVWVQVPALDAVWHFGDQVQAIFGDPYRFWWTLASIAALAFSKA
jgi:hypothetical protein